MSRPGTRPATSGTNKRRWVLVNPQVRVGVIPEPMSGFYDHLGRAYHDGKILIVTPGRPAEWSVRVTLGGS